MHITVRATVKDEAAEGGKTVVLVGNSYKEWFTQLTEFIYRNYGSETEGWHYKDVEGIVLEVEKSPAPWIGGGLKWTIERAAQAGYEEEYACTPEVERAGRGPRQYSVIATTFEPWPAGKKRVIKELKRY